MLFTFPVRLNAGWTLAPKFAAAAALEGRGQTAQAIAEYQSIVEEDPSSVRAWTNLGNALRESSNPKEAEQAYRRALAIHPTDADALNNLAWQLLVQGLALEEAESLARKAVHHAQVDRDLYLDTLGRILLARGNCTEAEQVLSRALSELPAARIQVTSALLAAMGQAQQRCGHPDRSRETFERALSAGPDPTLRREIEAALARTLPAVN